jgi:hypothetical protein
MAEEKWPVIREGAAKVDFVWLLQRIHSPRPLFTPIAPRLG